MCTKGEKHTEFDIKKTRTTTIQHGDQKLQFGEWIKPLPVALFYTYIYTGWMWITFTSILPIDQFGNFCERLVIWTAVKLEPAALTGPRRTTSSGNRTEQCMDSYRKTDQAGYDICQRLMAITHNIVMTVSPEFQQHSQFCEIVKITSNNS